MIEFFKKTGKKLFGAQLEFRGRLFNIVAFAGIIITLIACIIAIITSLGIAHILQNLVAMALAIALLWYSSASGKYQLCYNITVICVFILLFPFLFFSSGGYHSGMPLYFVFAVLFTVFMLEGKKMIIFIVMELTLYASLCLYAYFNPDKINSLGTEANVLLDIIVNVIIVSVSLAITISFHFKTYIQRQNELEAARRQVEEYARMKSELFAGMSHEMRTPLTVMSAYAQFAVEQIRESGANGQTLADLAAISDEAKRLAEMADSTLKILMTGSGAAEGSEADGSEQKNLPVDIADLSSRLARLMEPIASRKGCKLTTLIKGDIPVIYGDADTLTQLVWNLLQNVITHSECDNAELTVETDELGVKITIRDDGQGVKADIMPRIFESGVSGKKEGSGIGLSICRDIARRHGGDISVKSEQGAGTCVIVVLRGVITEAANG